MPLDTKVELEKNATAVSNYTLFFRRYVAFDVQSGKIEGLTDALLDLYSKGEGKKVLDACYLRHLQMLDDADAVSQTAVVQGRMVVGLGDKGAREVGITLHSLHGFPIIPGSALKGLARTFALSTLNTKGDDGKVLDLSSQAKAIEDYAGRKQDGKQIAANAEYDQFIAVFGALESAGGAIFFDALPRYFTLARDIMNPHHNEYYRSQGKDAPPSDYQSPVPIIFLSVDKGSEFLFGVAARKRDTDIRRLAWEWLKAGLSTVGVGAKTTSGYGVFANFQKEK